jgi:DNA-binding CsgD family transcriptional regulator
MLDPWDRTKCVSEHGQGAVGDGRERRQARELEEAVMAHTSAAVARLAREGYSVRDAAALLDLTPGRVSQLLNA